MNWNEARAREVGNWQAIRRSIGADGPMAIRTAMNRAGEFCRLARLRAEARGETDVCNRCPACEQFGGCQDVRTSVYEALVVGDVARAREIVDLFLDRLAALETPEELEVAPTR